MTDKPLVLICDDDVTIREFAKDALTQDNCDVLLADTAENALNIARARQPDLFVFDIMLPGMNGYELCRKVREFSNAPVLFLSARDSELDKVVGLEIGGDDYLAKPFGANEFVSRCRALRRRHRTNAVNTSSLVTASHITLDTLAHTVTNQLGDPIDLTPREFELLSSLIRRAGKVVSRDELLREAWGWEYLTDTKTVDTHIKRLRDKFSAHNADPNLIETVRGYGYRFRSI